jgi:hypothetical protein
MAKLSKMPMQLIFRTTWHNNHPNFGACAFLKQCGENVLKPMFILLANFSQFITLKPKLLFVNLKK